MRQLVRDYKSGVVRIEDVPAPACGRGGILVATRASLISAGTERQTLEFARANLVQKALARPDLVRQVVTKARTDGVGAALAAADSKLGEWAPLGYSSSGVVVEVGEGVTRLRVGDLVACGGGGHASHAELAYVPQNFAARVPDGVGADDAAFATLGAIALHGIHRAGVQPGDRVGVVGLGLLGQLTVEILAAYGATVVGVDMRKDAVARAMEAGALAGMVTGEEDPAAFAKRATGDVGLDAVIVTAASASSEPLATAAAMARKGGRICVVGLVGMEADRRTFYDKELDLVVAKSYGPGRDDPDHAKGEREYPHELSRWTVARNMEEFLRLVAVGRVRPRRLIAERVPFADAPAAYERLLEGALTGGTALLEYAPLTPARSRSVELRPPAAPGARSRPGVAFIGAGAFARGVLLPALARAGDVERVAIAGAGALNATQAARTFDFARATTDVGSILADPAVHAVVIATRHDSHARYATAALKAGKDVLVEKPLALSVEELREVVDVAHATGGRLMVGFNRRFAPMVREIVAHFQGRRAPLLMTYRVNAGALPADHWLRDPLVGGGRVLGEVCHFVDTMQAIAGSRPTRVHATSPAAGIDAEDHLVASIEFEDGSRGTIVYSGSGPKGLAKEHLEVIGADRAAILDNFRRLELFDGARRRTRRAFKQDKGHAAEVAAFFEAVRGGAPSPVALEEIVATSLATMAIPVACAQKRAVDVERAP